MIGFHFVLEEMRNVFVKDINESSIFQPLSNTNSFVAPMIKSFSWQFSNRFVDTTRLGAYYCTEAITNAINERTLSQTTVN